MDSPWNPSVRQRHITATHSRPAAKQTTATGITPSQPDLVSRIIRVTNVHKQASNGDLATFFSEYEVLDVRRSYISRTDTTMASPTCWVLLGTPDEARMAKFRLHDVPLHGRPVRVELAEALRPSSVMIPRVQRNRFVVDPLHAGSFIPWDQQPRVVRRRRNTSLSAISYGRAVTPASVQPQNANPPMAAAGPREAATQQPNIETPSDTRPTRWSWSGQPPILSEEDWFNFPDWLARQGRRRSRVYDAINYE